MTPQLQNQWQELWSPLSEARTRPWLDRLHALYTQPHRHYHNLVHIAECLAHFDAAAALVLNPRAVRAALWFHDAVYDPRGSENEARSAELAMQMLADVGLEQELDGTVQRLILATRHNAPPADADEAVIIDVDLAILGARNERFDAYERAIRLEYAHVPDDHFRAGRAAILRTFLQRPRIYATDRFADRYEQAARMNLERSIRALSDGTQ